MSRVAIVTGGTRGIGAAISIALKEKGYSVAASYAGNDTAANAFKEETGIPVYKWDVADFDACAAGIKKIEDDLGPVEVLINNAGITKDGAFHKMSLEQWQAVINTNLNGLFNMSRNVWEGMRSRGFGRIVNISSINGQRWFARSRKTFWTNTSCLISLSVVLASQKRSRVVCRSLFPMTLASSRGRL